MPTPTSTIGASRRRTSPLNSLGGMLLNKDAIAEVLEKLRPGDFHRSNHQAIYEMILDLYGRR
jgi:replicative DNA helicase